MNSALGLFLEQHCVRPGRAEPHLVALDIGDEADRDVVVVAGMAALGTFRFAPKSLLVSLIRSPSTWSTVPTWTPSAPITSICSLIALASAIEISSGWSAPQRMALQRCRR